MRSIEDMFIGTTFKDFLLRPQHGQVLSRTKENIDLSMPLSRNIILRGAPIVSANMRTVTGGRMMKAMSSMGCFGFIHRRYSKEVQAEKVREVKRSQSYIIENPLVIHQEAIIGEARELIRKKKVSGLLVCESPGSMKLVGVLSTRDIFGLDSELVKNRMSIFTELICGYQNISMEEAELRMSRRRVEKLPLIDDDANIVGLITMKDLKMAKQKPYTTKDSKGRLLVGATIGASGDYMERAELLVDTGVDVILMDIAHGHSEVIKLAINNFKAKFPGAELIAGNIATGQGAKFLMDLGVDAIKAGVGHGKGCRTRLDVRFGVAQLQAVREVYLATEGKVPIIADGGIEDDGDIISALLIGGASTVMLGSMLAGTDEAPGLVENGVKMYKGETSIEASLEEFNDDENLEALMDDVQAPEGQPRPVKYIEGGVAKVIRRIRGHLKSAVSYAGTKSLIDAQKKMVDTPWLYVNRRPLTEAAKKESFDR